MTEELDGPDDFWRKEIWPLRSPDLNPLDNNVSSVLQDKVQVTSHTNLESLKARNVAIWEALEAVCIISSCKGFRSRVDAVVADEGDYIE